MHYEISRGFKTGKQITTAQRTSGTFAEEPVVLGKVLRRGMRPLHINEEQFNLNKAQLLRLLLSGSIEIHVIKDGASSRLDYRTATGISAPVPPVAVEAVEEKEAPAVAEQVEEVVEAAKEEPEEEVETPVVDESEEVEEPVLSTRSQA